MLKLCLNDTVENLLKTQVGKRNQNQAWKKKEESKNLSKKNELIQF